MPTNPADEPLREILVQWDSEEEFLSGVGTGFFGFAGTGLVEGPANTDDADRALFQPEPPPPQTVPRPTAPPYAAPTPGFRPGLPPTVTPPPAPPPPPSAPPPAISPRTIVVSAPAAALGLAAGVVGGIATWLMQGFDEAQARLDSLFPRDPPLQPEVSLTPPTLAEVLVQASPPVQLSPTTITVTSRPATPGVIRITPDWLDDPFADPMTRFTPPPTVSPFPMPVTIEAPPDFAPLPFFPPLTVPQSAPVPLAPPSFLPLPTIFDVPAAFPEPAVRPGIPPVVAPPRIDFFPLPTDRPTPTRPAAPFVGPGPSPIGFALPLPFADPLTGDNPTVLTLPQPRLRPPTRRRRTATCEDDEGKYSPCERGFYRTDKNGKLSLKRWSVSRKCMQQ